ncbi:T3SS effector HopA1 family protein [Rathayibacter tanaceti]|uniref:Uncharacterized protein n=2 Tax=Rathayibacter tanaceti TaxID=1671680 RepID=A0A162GT15_9MICO|nr:T3SS effector HopA1 family protein [Rathayibacter tanaceti]KZX22198.1 hypothetical protein ACH61_00684 [Rathayibacter tanaceti]QHC55089.1 hypothetical protein GSU10_05200 [Rathayibacter tanaceti]TCO33817.1 hypothetical protein EV639_11332 [Rathayibacter tanaceti]
MSAAGPSAADLARLLDLDADRGVLTLGDARLDLDALDPRRGLSTWLYANLHAGNPDVFATTSLLPDEAFEEEIRAALPDPGVIVPVEAPLGASASAGLVELHRVRVRFDEDDLTGEAGARRARVSCLRPNLTPGFFMFVHERADRPAAPGSMVRHYVRFEDPDEALRFWAASVHELARLGLSFRTKMLSRPDAFPRNDSLVYYSSVDAESVAEALSGLVASSGAETSGSPLCAEVVPGLRVAADPLRSGREQSFGESRCAALAVGVAAAVTAGGPLVGRLRDALAEAGIDPDDVARNLAPGASGDRAA